MYRLTRRGLLEAGAGALAGAAIATTPAFAARRRRRGTPPGDGRYVGEIRLFPGTYVPDTWLACDGQEFDQIQYHELDQVIGSTYGTIADRYGTRPLLPDLRGRTAIGAGEGSGGPARKRGDKERALAAKGDAPAGLGLRPIISPYGGAEDQLLAEIRAFAFYFNPRFWLPCTGERVELRDHVDVYSLLGDTYGGDGRTFFQTPNLSGRSPLGVGGGPGIPGVELGERTGDLAPGAEPHARRLHLNYCIAMAGIWPQRPGRKRRPNSKVGLTAPFIGEVRAFGSADVPEGWLPCNGQRLPIRGNQRLFSLLGTAFGGDGRENFNVPELRGRAIAGVGEAGERAYQLGDVSAHEPGPNPTRDVLPFNTITWGIAGETFVYPSRA